METQNTTTKIPTPRADQDQLIANRIAETRRKINAVLADDELKARFTARGCTPDDLAEGLAHCNQTQAGYDARQVALGEEKTAYKTLTGKRKAARDAFAELRALTKLAYPRDKPTQQSLRATGRVPLDDDTFLTDARAAGHAATQVPYASELARRGHNPSVYAAALDDFDAARNTARRAADTAVESTALRDAADKTLQTWLLTFEGIIALELKRDPHLTTRLG